MSEANEIKRGKKTEHRLYKKWKVMRYRCRTETSPDYKNYGGRGITVCKEWDDFWCYVDHVENLPEAYKENYSIDRIDNDKGYFPGNLRWASSSQQNCNRRKPKRWGKGYYKMSGRGYRVQFKINGKVTYFGYYKTEEEAKAKADEIKLQLDKQ